MLPYDIVKLIYINIEDFDELYDACVVNKTTKKVFSKKDFWYDYFNYHDIPIKNLRHNKLIYWINELKAEDLSICISNLSNRKCNYVFETGRKNLP